MLSAITSSLSEISCTYPGQLTDGEDVADGESERHDFGVEISLIGRTCQVFLPRCLYVSATRDIRVLNHRVASTQ